MTTFDEMVEMAREAQVPDEVEARLDATLANLPAREHAPVETETSRERRGGWCAIRGGRRKAACAIAGVAACAALALCLVGSPLVGGAGGGSQGDAAAPAAAAMGNAFTVRQAFGAELAPGSAADGGTLGFTDDGGEMGDSGCYTGLAFKVEGDSIARVRVSISKGELCRMTRTELDRAGLDAADPVHGDGFGEEVFGVDDDTGYLIRWEAVGATVDEDYDPSVAYGFYQPASNSEELLAIDDPKESFWSLFDSFDGAELDIEVTYEDGSTEARSYDLHSGKVKVVFPEDGGDFELTQEFTSSYGEPFVYGLLATERA